MSRACVVTASENGFLLEEPIPIEIPSNPKLPELNVNLLQQCLIYRTTDETLHLA
jgi:hypothetical protein